MEWRNVGVDLTIVAYNQIFSATNEYSNGLLTPAAYPQFALTTILIIFIGIVVSSTSTLKQGASLSKPSNDTPFSINRTFEDLYLALQSYNFQILLAVILVQGAVSGIALWYPRWVL